MKVKELVKKLEKAGWYYSYQRGSHMYFKHKDKPNKVPVPNHKGDIPKGTLNSILKQAGIK